MSAVGVDGLSHERDPPQPPPTSRFSSGPAEGGGSRTTGTRVMGHRDIPRSRPRFSVQLRDGPLPNDAVGDPYCRNHDGSSPSGRRGRGHIAKRDGTALKARRILGSNPSVSIGTTWPPDGGVEARTECAYTRRREHADTAPPRILFSQRRAESLNAMHGTSQQLKNDLETEYRLLDAGCRRHGVTAPMFRTAKYLFNITALAFAAYLIEAAALDPLLAAGLAALLITGPEGLELWLVKQGVLSESSNGATASDSDQ